VPLAVLLEAVSALGRPEPDLAQHGAQHANMELARHILARPLACAEDPTPFGAAPDSFKW
jgi:hypothetical protein